MNCAICGEKLKPKEGDFFSGIMSTLLGYSSPPGHNHDDNCLTQLYTCANGHDIRLSKRRTCPACDWKGKEKCFCHPGNKVDEWPE